MKSRKNNADVEENAEKLERETDKTTPSRGPYAGPSRTSILNHIRSNSYATASTRRKKCWDFCRSNYPPWPACLRLGLKHSISRAREEGMAARSDGQSGGSRSYLRAIFAYFCN